MYTRVLQREDYQPVSSQNKISDVFPKLTLSSRPEYPFAVRWNVEDEDYPALVAQPLLHWLANFLSVGVFEGIQTVNELLQIRPPEGNKYCWSLQIVFCTNQCFLFGRLAAEQNNLEAHLAGARARPS